MSYGDSPDFAPEIFRIGSGQPYLWSTRNRFRCAAPGGDRGPLSGQTGAHGVPAQGRCARAEDRPGHPRTPRYELPCHRETTVGYAISRHRGVCRDRECARCRRPLNVQVRVDSSGAPRVFEINPRFSGSSALTAAAGVDEIGGLLSQALGDASSPLRDTWRDGVVMVRHAAETFVCESEFSQRRRSLHWPG